MTPHPLGDVGGASSSCISRPVLSVGYMKGIGMIVALLCAHVLVRCATACVPERTHTGARVHTHTPAPPLPRPHARTQWKSPRGCRTAMVYGLGLVLGLRGKGYRAVAALRRSPIAHAAFARHRLDAHVTAPSQRSVPLSVMVDVAESAQGWAGSPVLLVQTRVRARRSNPNIALVADPRGH